MKSQKFDVILNRYSTLIIFLIPALTVFTLFVVLPIGEAAYYSFYRWNGYGDPEKFVGFKNYAYLFRNRVFIISLKNNFYIIALSLFVQLPFALLVALMISDKIKGATFFRTIFFLPYILAEIVAGLIWAYIYDGNYGLVSTIWGFFGIDPIFMVGDKDLALIAILIVIFWKYFGIHMMIYIAGLQAISKEVLEAAKVDGAGPITTAWRIKIPILLPTIRLSVFLSILGSLQLFDIIIVKAIKNGTLSIPRAKPGEPPAFRPRLRPPPVAARPPGMRRQAVSSKMHSRINRLPSTETSR